MEANTNKKKLSLDDFKAKVDGKPRTADLNSIAGGILGACHCVINCIEAGGIRWEVTYCVYYQQR